MPPRRPVRHGLHGRRHPRRPTPAPRRVPHDLHRRRHRPQRGDQGHDGQQLAGRRPSIRRSGRRSEGLRRPVHRPLHHRHPHLRQSFLLAKYGPDRGHRLVAHRRRHAPGSSAGQPKRRKQLPGERLHQRHGHGAVWRQPRPPVHPPHGQGGGQSPREGQGHDR